MGSLTHHNLHHSAGLADYEGRHHVGSSSHASDADRRRAILSEAHSNLTLGPSPPTLNDYNNAARSLNHGIEVLQAQQVQQAQALQNYQQQQQQSQTSASRNPSTYLTPPDAESIGARQAALNHQMLSNNGLLSGQPTAPANSISTNNNAAAANGNTANPPTHRKAISITEKDSLAMVMHSPKVPRCISPKGGSISDFTAEMTCLFWFETPSVFVQASKIDTLPDDAWVPRLSANGFPTEAFRGWVNRMINTTQVTQNVILLALLFIYRLKSLNVIVRGKPGSEFRLLTVALMLGNKFLDDNTYTNKTWSDVSGLHVKEIHVMEVEFLSNMRYSLLVSKEEWEDWLAKLAKFRMYYERAKISTMSPPNLAAPRPAVSPMSSPTTYHHQPASSTVNLSPTSVAGAFQMPSYSPNSRPNFAAPVSATVQLPAWPGQMPTSQVDPTMNNARNGNAKRSMSFEDITEPPPKRSSHFVSPGSALPPPIPSQTRTQPNSVLSLVNSVDTMPSSLVAPAAETRRLPAPQLTLNTAAAQMQLAAQHNAQNNALANYQASASMQVPQQQQQQQQVAPVPQAQVPVALPPLLAHGQRAMATVYSSNAGSTLPSAAPSIPALSTTLAPASNFASQPSMMLTTGPVANNASNIPSYPPPQNFSTPTKRMSPMNAMTPNAASVYAAAANSSPLAESFPHLASGVHTPLTHSPSVYLQQRSSPYRPIRNVHMLLNPPPTSSLQDYQALGPILIPPTQMYYQPLGRPNDLRSGIVPEFQGMQQYATGPMRHGASLTPIHALQQQQQQAQAQAMQAQAQAMQMPLRDARAKQAQQVQQVQQAQQQAQQAQQQVQQMQQQQQQLQAQAHAQAQAQAQAYAHQQSQYNN
ncbi:hypothetical protein Sste5346_004099 [Sporothrix stenoceras]|uniref:Cyclin-like protein n=1 Tax=Sporothrix stenoceras TaxID=5173 RepID=A0ABR3Z9V0_9PEZI